MDPKQFQTYFLSRDNPEYFQIDDNVIIRSKNSLNEMTIDAMEYKF